MKTGAFTFVLHSHLPYCRNAGRWPHGEEWIHEAASECYLPLLDALYSLREEKLPFRLTISITPVLLEQLADPLVLDHLKDFIRDKLQRAEQDVQRFEKAGESHLIYLARFYLERYRKLWDDFHSRFSGQIIPAFKQLQDEGYLELCTSAATHAYLPLLERDSSIHAQLETGRRTYQRHFGRRPLSAWLPECGYRPAYYTAGEKGQYVKPGLEAFLAELGIGCFFAETHTIEGGQPVGKALGAVIGPYGNIVRRYVVPQPVSTERTNMTTYLPYWLLEPEVAVLGRNDRTSMQVWSADWGYPGDFSYREFHKKDGVSGLWYWKVTGAHLDLAHKQFYDPYWAFRKAQEHAAHFSRLVEDLLAEYQIKNQKYGVIVSSYDTELFGHWWFEGVDWLKHVLANLSRSPSADLVTASSFLQEQPPAETLALPEGSWGQAGGHFTWLNVDTKWMWPQINQASVQMEELVDAFPDATGLKKEALDQAARELLLLQSSDWPFLVTTGQAREYAVERFQHHLTRFQRLREDLLAGREDAACVADFYEKDKLFPDIDYTVFRKREIDRGESSSE
ncbi:MAG: DUF1957 domain-containing protein [Chloroflexi bacterium]|nr:DUF1957 domain-containing protein [Chloroflexota bacterium]